MRRQTLVQSSPERRSLLREHDFRLLFIGETASKFGTAVSGVAMPLVAVTTLQLSTFQIGVLTAAQWLPWLLIGLPAGALVDRLPRRAVMVTSNICSALVLGSVPVAAALNVLSVGYLLTAALLSGVASVFFSTAYIVYLPSLVRRDQLVEGNAKLQASEQVADIGGFGLGGLIVQVFSAPAGLATDAATFVVSTLCLLRIRSRESRERTGKAVESGGLVRQVRAGLVFTFGDRLLRIFTLNGTLANLFTTAISTLSVVFLVRVVDLRATVVGLLLASGALGGILGALCVRRVTDRLGTARGLLVCAVTMAPFSLLVPLTSAGLAVACFVVGTALPVAGVVAYNVVVSSFRQLYCPPELLGRVTTAMRFVPFSAIPLGGLLGGWLGGALGIREALWVLTAGSLLPAIWLLISPLRRMRNLPASQSLSI